MKTNKFNFSDYDEVSRDEMRDMVSTSSGPLPPIDSGSGSGSGSDASPEVIACNGKTVGDECYFTGINDLSYKGTCDYGSLHQQLYCHTNYVSSGSGAIKESPEVEACKNKGAGEACQWTTAGGSSFNGKCLSGTLHKGIYCQMVSSGSGTTNPKIEACKGKKEGDYCEFITDKGELSSGKCLFAPFSPLHCSNFLGGGN